MWFGDLVTTAWWDDIWLNEAFATWMGHRTMAEWFPDGEYSRLTLTGGFDVMKLDSLPSTRRIREPIHSVDDIDNAFDDITYSKGAAVLQMFESYVGDAAFREGVRLHMERHAYGNATTDEFLHSVADGSHHQEIIAAFHSFTDQPNVPLVTVHRHCGAGGNGSVSVAQMTDTPIGVSLPKRQWQIPLCMRVAGAAQKSCTLLTAAQANLAMPLACSGALMPNAEGAGYYRFTMDGAGWRALIAAAPKLSAAEQIALLRNLEAGVHAGNTKAELLFEGLRAVAPVGSWDALAAAEDIMRDLHDTAIAPEDRAAFEAMARNLIRPRVDVVGLAPKPGEPVASALIRSNGAWFLADTAGDRDVRARFGQGRRGLSRERRQDERQRACRSGAGRAVVGGGRERPRFRTAPDRGDENIRRSGIPPRRHVRADRGHRSRLPARGLWPGPVARFQAEREPDDAALSRGRCRPPRRCVGAGSKPMSTSSRRM